MNLFNLSSEDFNYTVEDKAGGDPIGNAVTERHKHSGKKGGNSLVQIIPLNLFKSRHHHYTHYNQGRGCSCSRHQTGNGRQKDTSDKEQRCCHTGQTGTPSGADSRGALYVSRSIGGSKHSADRSSNGVGKQGLVHLGFKTGTSLHEFFVFRAENAASPTCSDKSADCIKGIG